MSAWERLTRLEWRPAGLLAVFLFYSLLTFTLWDARGRYQPRGDEEFYLIAAGSIIERGSVELTAATEAEFATRAIYKRGLPRTPDGHVDLGGSHLYVGAHGAFSIHGLGLPLVLAVPFGLFGTVGAKLFLIGPASMLVLIGWRISGFFSDDATLRGWSVVAVFVAMPFLPAANQVYPDLPGGLICLFGLFGLMRVSYAKDAGSRVPFALALAALPWLHIKLAAPAAVLAVAGAFLVRRRGARAVALELLPLGIALGLLAFYNYYAFRSPVAAYGPTALTADLASFTVFVGLLLDQNQGMFAQNPVFLVGVLFAVPFCLRYPFVGLVALVLFFALIVPNAMHDNRYGGDSLSGRFGWAAATVLTIPTLYGLIALGTARRRIATAIVAAGIAFQTFEWLFYAVGVQDLYQRFNRSPDTYSIFFGPLGRWLPAFYDVTWAMAHWPNWIAVLLLLGVFAAGIWLARRDPLDRRIAALPMS